MDPDCGFTRDEYWFRYRSSAILLREEKILFVRSAIGGYYYMIGGGVHLGETSEDCVIRELAEETGVKCEAVRLAMVCENFFEGDESTAGDRHCHELQFCWICTAPSDAVFPELTDQGEQLVWLPASDVSSYDIRPRMIRDNIGRSLADDTLIHIVNNGR